MATRKNRPVLFEVMSRSQRTSAPPAASAGTSGSDTGASGAPEAWPTLAERAGSVRVAGGRLYLVVGWTQGVLAAVALIVILVAAYEIGQRSVQVPAAPAADLNKIMATPDARNTPRTEAAVPMPARGGGAGGPVATPVGPPRGEEAAGSKPPAPPVAPVPRKEPEAGDTYSFVEGTYYVVVQHFRTRDRDRAVAAKEFLRSKGVNCVIRPGTGDLELVATDAFASEPQAQNLVRRVLDLGKDYWNSGGGYEFTGTKARKF